MCLARIRIAAIGTAVAAIIQLNGSDDRRIGSENQEVKRQLAVFVSNALIMESAPEAQHLEQLHLSQDDVLWSSLNQAVIKHPLRIGQKWVLGLKRPQLIQCYPACWPCFNE